MLLKYFYDRALAHASYMVGCQRAKVAIIVDPGRDVQQYIQAAGREGFKLAGVAETHIHADYVSGARELADRVGAKLYLSDEGPAGWKYGFAKDYDAQLLNDGDVFTIGNIRFEVMHTPGHTPESVSFVLTDRGGGADKPMGIFTGDFVFVGSVGRPDLLETSVGVRGSAEQGARDLFRSAKRFKQLPDHLQVWPAHGAGSACGKGLGAVPSSTVGYEKLFNPALKFEDEDAFIRYILADQPDAPKYFAEMKRVNKEGPEVLGEAEAMKMLPANDIEAAKQRGNIIDLSPAGTFAQGHVSGVMNIPLGMLASWGGWLIDYSRPVYLVGEPGQIPEAARVLRKIGLDDLRGYFDAAALKREGLASETYAVATPSELAPRIRSGEVKLIDVRSDAEWNAGHIPGAEHRFLGRLPENLSGLANNNGQPIVMQCQGGVRSAVAASILQAAGHEVVNLAGGFDAWCKAGLPVVDAKTSSCAASG